MFVCVCSVCKSSLVGFVCVLACESVCWCMLFPCLGGPHVCVIVRVCVYLYVLVCLCLCLCVCACVCASLRVLACASAFFCVFLCDRVRI